MWRPDIGDAKRSYSMNADINVTSLVDVAFTLLVIFIITAPILQGGIEVDLPRADTAPITSSEGVVVTVERDGTIHLGEVEIESLQQFEEVFPEYVRERDVTEIYLRGDAEAPYGHVARLIGVMRRLDVAEVGLVAEPLEEGGG
ncbi:MAG: ExbD/TolR family protein [Gemmatimonadota bacterium]